MAQEQSLDILKEAILLERRGRSFYLQAAAQSTNTDVQAFFELMANEEKRHVQILGEQFTKYIHDGQFATLQPGSADGQPLADMVLSDEVKGKIAAADFEAAAISAAVAMEERAVQLYSRQADAAQDPNEKALYKWLADWEQGHLSFLADLDREIKQRIWNDNQFWPF
jgi:rubrerythrin